MQTLPLLPPIFQALQGAETILLAGAGGGYDIFCGLPLYFALTAQGKKVILANSSFSSLERSTARRLTPSLFEIKHTTQADLRYFPELHLARYLSQTQATSVFAFARTGAKPLHDAFDWLVHQFEVDTVLLIDGGTDSLMRGDEVSLGTPEEDAASLSAVYNLEGVRRKLLLCLGFGVDAHHGVSHAHYLEAVAALAKQGAYLGVWSLTSEMPEVQRYREALTFVQQEMPDFPSIVSTSVLDAVEGQFGNYHSTEKTTGSELFINPLMGLYWAFELEGVAKRNLYLDSIRQTESIGDIARAVEAFRMQLPHLRPWKNLPM